MFDTLKSAIRTAIAHGNDMEGVSVEHWAITYHCEPDEVRRQWQAELTKAEPNTILDDFGGEGK